MEDVRFGNTGMKVSRICVGCMSYGGPHERWPWALSRLVAISLIIGATKPHPALGYT